MSDALTSSQTRVTSGLAVCVTETQLPLRRKISLALACIFSAGVGFAAFAPALHNEFVFDDLIIVAYNPTLTESGKWYRFWREPWWPRGTKVDCLYRPFTLWSFRANLVVPELLGHSAFSSRPRVGVENTTQNPDSARLNRAAPGTPPDPFWFHMVNLVIHGLTAVGVALLAYRLSEKVAAAWIAGLIFGAHPINTEAIVTAYGRAELLAGFFCVWLLLRHAIPINRRINTVRFHVTNMLLFLAALMSKEHALFVWPVLLLLDCWPQSAGNREQGTGSREQGTGNGNSAGRAAGPCSSPRRVKPCGESAAADPIPVPYQSWRDWLNRVIGPAHAGYALAVSFFLTLRASVLLWHVWLPPSDVRHWEAPLRHATTIEHLLTPLRLLWLTLELLVWPPRLCPIWSKPSLQLANHFAPDVIAGLLAVVLFVALGAILWKTRNRLGAVFLGSLIVLALPTQALPLANWFFAERWLYMPTILLVALFAVIFARGGFPALLFSIGLAFLLLPASWSYTAAFKDNQTMFSEVVRRQPDNIQGLRFLGFTYLREGDYAATVQTMRRITDRFQDLDDVYNALAYAYLELGDGERALDAIDRCEQLQRGISMFDRTEQRLRARELIAARNRWGSRPAASQASMSSP